MGLLSSGIGHPESVSLIGNLSLNISESLIFLEESPGHPLLLALLWAHPVLGILRLKRKTIGQLVSQEMQVA